MTDRRTRLRWHSYTLLGGTLGALLFSWGVAQVYEVFPLEPNPETRAVKVVIWAIITHLIMLLIWTSYVLEDILRSEEDRKYQRFASVLLFLPYFPLVVLMIWKFIEGIASYHQRNQLLEPVNAYAYRTWPNQLEAIWSGPHQDSLDILLKDNRLNKGRKVYLTESGQALAIIKEQQLAEFQFCPDDRLLPLKMVQKLPSSQDAEQVLIPLPIMKFRYTALNSLVNDELVVLDSLGNQWNDTLSGFQNFLVRASYQKPPAYQDVAGNFWFLIWEQTATVSPECLYLVKYHSKKRQIFSIHLSHEHRAAFSANRVKGLYVTDKNAFVLVNSGYLYFRIPK